MARKKQTWRFKDFESFSNNGRWTRIAGDMIQSKAWKALGVYEQSLYLHMKNKFRVNKQGDSNERNISFTYEEGQQLMSKARFIKAIDRLIEVGFIDLVEHWQHSKRPTIYGLSTRWKDYGTEQFKKEHQRTKAKSKTKGHFYGNQYTKS